MRIWKGAELEGNNKGVLTLFVESTHITVDDVNIIKSYLTKDIKVLYLGAGRVDTVYVHQTLFDDLHCYVKQETSVKNINTVNLDNVNECIVRIDYCCNIQHTHKIIMKFDNSNDVYVSDFVDCLHHTSLELLNNGQFIGTDELLYIKEN